MHPAVNTPPVTYDEGLPIIKKLEDLNEHIGEVEGDFIGLLGCKGVGKDSVADYLNKMHRFEKYSFAEPLKSIVARLFDVDYEMLAGLSSTERYIREHNTLPNIGLTGRQLLQQVGEGMRQIYSNVWVDALMRNTAYKREELHTSVVVSDVRYQNEVSAIKEAGGKIFYLSWHDNLHNYTNNPEPVATDEHISESGIKALRSQADVIVLRSAFAFLAQ